MNDEGEPVDDFIKRLNEEIDRNLTRYPYACYSPHWIHHYPEIIGWCKENLSEQVGERWIAVGNDFRFCTQKDAALFMMFWG